MTGGTACKAARKSRPHNPRSSPTPRVCVSSQHNAGKKICVNLQCYLPVKKKDQGLNKPGKDFVTLYFALPENLLSKLVKTAKKQGTTESAVLRQMIDSYLAINKGKSHKFEPMRKTPIIGMKTTPRTVRRDQDKKLREIAEKTGRSISEIVREEIQTF